MGGAATVLSICLPNLKTYWLSYFPNIWATASVPACLVCSVYPQPMNPLSLYHVSDVTDIRKSNNTKCQFLSNYSRVNLYSAEMKHFYVILLWTKRNWCGASDKSRLWGGAGCNLSGRKDINFFNWIPCSWSEIKCLVSTQLFQP